MEVNTFKKNLIQKIFSTISALLNRADTLTMSQSDAAAVLKENTLVLVVVLWSLFHVYLITLKTCVCVCVGGVFLLT